MRTTMPGSARLMFATAAVAVLLTACGGRSSSSKPSAEDAQSATKAAVSGGMSADCVSYSNLLKGSGAAMGSAAKLQAAATQASAAGASYKDPKLREAATKMSQYDKQEADYQQNPDSAPIPDSNLMNAANNDWADVCVPHK